jgi:hypothetical protein
VKSIRYFTLAALLFSAGAARAADESPFKFEFHGFVTGSLFSQDQVFLGGKGQDNLFGAPTPAQAAPNKLPPVVTAPTNGVATKSGSFYGGDVRQSRWIFVMTGPTAWGGTPKAYFEGDLLGGPAAGGNNQIESTQLRIRSAYSEVKWGGTQLQIGQYSAHLILAQLSATIAHIANPITFGTGTIGSRAIGVRLIHGITSGDMRLELAGELLAPKWQDPPLAASAASISQGWASGLPQLGARLKADGKSGALAYSLYVAGVFESVNLKGFGDSVVQGGQPGVVLQDGVTRKTSLSPWAAEVGGNFTFAPISLAGNIYTGKATGGAWAGNLNQSGDISDLGFWVQLGLIPTKQIGIYGLFGQGASKKSDVRLWVPPASATAASPRTDNQLIGVIARFTDGNYTFAAEFFHFKTKYLTGTFAAPGADINTTGNQYIASAHYAF